jgi:hypothetical protein
MSQARVFDQRQILLLRLITREKQIVIRCCKTATIQRGTSAVRDDRIN